MTGRTDDDYANLLDGRQAACLCDAGAPGWQAVVAVNRDGHPATLWLWRDDGPDCAHPGQPPAHEHTGALPQPYRHRVDYRVGTRCGQPTASGRSCRRHVYDGRPCWQHRSVTRRECS